MPVLRFPFIRSYLKALQIFSIRPTKSKIQSLFDQFHTNHKISMPNMPLIVWLSKSDLHKVWKMAQMNWNYQIICVKINLIWCHFLKSFKFYWFFSRVLLKIYWYSLEIIYLNILMNRLLKRKWRIIAKMTVHPALHADFNRLSKVFFCVRQLKRSFVETIILVLVVLILHLFWRINSFSFLKI